MASHSCTAVYVSSILHICTGNLGCMLINCNYKWLLLIYGHKMCINIATYSYVSAIADCYKSLNSCMWKEFDSHMYTLTLIRGAPIGDILLLKGRLSKQILICC